MSIAKTINYLSELKECRICPRNCGVNRFTSKLGYCGSDASFSISSITIHSGEEPVISGEKGICNVFFSRCNLSCVYCQNYQISNRKGKVVETKLSLHDTLNQIITHLNTGIKLLGFVSPSHHIPQMKAIIAELNNLGYYPRIVYNTNAYDTVESLRKLEGIVDIYLPDFKYLSSKLSKEYSDVRNYPDIAIKALKEMFRQKGNKLFLDETGLAKSGMIIRHLVLPNNIGNSIKVLEHIAAELSPEIHISLMSQYLPTPNVSNHQCLNRTLSKNEYFEITEKLDELEIKNGWIQELESANNYKPDFILDKPFST